ncbi:hypothetical protein ACET3Z_014854 [Daucus carota]
MAPKTLFLSPLYPFLRPLNPPNFSAHLFIYNPKPLYITCNSTNSHQNKPHSQSTPTIEPGGSGAAAPTRGDIFLERQQALEASAKVMLETKKIKKKKRDKMSKGAVVDYSCYGCGAPLQTVENDAPGYVDTDTYQLKKKHHQLRTVLCGRCQLLSHGHMITAVGGNGGYAGGKQFVTAEELREKLSHLRYEKALIVKLVDIVDFNGSFLARVRDLAGANPIILVVTKVDLLPKGTDFNCVGDWVVEATMKKKLKVISVHLTSSKSLVGIAGVVSEIQKEKKGRDVYILGSANVGKSAFINALLKMLSYKDPVAAMARRYKPIQSAVPGTTVGPIEINAFIGGKLYDTPGVHLHHRQAAVVHSEDLPLLAPRSRLRGQSLTSAQVPANDMAPEVIISNGMNGYSIFWGGLVRIDVLKVLPETCLTFYGPKAVKTCIVPTCKADEFYKKEIGILLTPPTGKQIVDQWSGLETHRELQINFEDANRPACDVAISGLGWICVEPVGKGVGVSSELNLEETEVAKELHLRIHVPKPVEIFIRPPMPVGKAGGDWYQYPDLTEKEEEVRPKWFF